jgi:hypothetical protein
LTWEAAQDPAAPEFPGGSAQLSAEDDELPGRPVHPPVAPIAAVGEIDGPRLDLLTPFQRGPLRRQPGGGRGISGDVGPGDSGPGAPAYCKPSNSSADFRPGRTSDCNPRSRTLNSPLPPGISKVGRACALPNAAFDVPGAFISVEGLTSTPRASDRTEVCPSHVRRPIQDSPFI